MVATTVVHHRISGASPASWKRTQDISSLPDFWMVNPSSGASHTARVDFSLAHSIAPNETGEMKNTPAGNRPAPDSDERGWSTGYLAPRDTPDLPRVTSTWELYALAQRLLWLSLDGDGSKSFSIWNQIPLAPGLLQEQRLASDEPGQMSLEFRTLRKDNQGRLLTVGSHYFQVSLVQAQCVLEDWVKQGQAAILHRHVVTPLAD